MKKLSLYISLLCLILTTGACKNKTGGPATASSEPTRLRRISYAVFCLKKKKMTGNDTADHLDNMISTKEQERNSMIHGVLKPGQQKNADVT